MALVDELAKLHELQIVDAQIYQREQAIKALDSGEVLKQQAIELMKKHDAAAAVLQKQEATLRDRELELKGVEQKRATVHDRLYSGRVTNPKELGDLQKDEEMLDARIGDLELQVLELMEQVEGLRTEATALAQALDTAKRRWRETVTRTQAETARLHKEITALRPAREQRAAVVEKPLLRRYDEIRARREGIGMAVTGTDICPICHIKLTAHTLGRLRAEEEIILCENCGRILMWSR